MVWDQCLHHKTLVHLVLPLSIIGGVGLSYLYLDYKKPEFPSKSIRTILLITILLISTLFAILTVTNSNFGVIPIYNSRPYESPEMVIPQIAPPTNSDVELANWFNKYGDKKSVIVSNNYANNQFLLTLTKQPIAGVLSSEHVIQWGFKKSELDQKKVGYLVFDKRLTFSYDPNRGIISHGGFIYYNKNYNITTYIPANAQLLYENENYTVFKV